MTEKVLTVRNPWARAMFARQTVLRKDVENRTWQPRTLGRIAIHVATKLDDAGVDFIGEGVTPDMLRDRGFVIGTVNVLSVHQAGSDGCAHSGCYGNPWAFHAIPGASIRQQAKPIFHWMLGNPREFVTPIRATGRLHLWDAGPTLAALIRDAEVAL